MYKQNFFYGLLIVFLVCLFHTSCNNDHQTAILLQKADQLIELQPSEALQLLETVEDPQSLNEELYMKYVVVNSLAQLMNDKPIPEGDELVKACTYFRRERNLQYAAVANYLVGSRFQDNGNYVQSLKWLYDAARYAEESRMDKLTGKALYRISFSYFEQGVYSEAALLSKQALSFFKRIPDCEDDIMASISMIGLWHYKTNELDSAFVKYNEALEVAQSINDSISEPRFKAFIGTVLGTKGETDRAISYLNDAMATVKTTEDSLLVYKGFLQTYNVVSNVRAARPYAEILSRRVHEMGIKSRQRETIRELSRYEEREGDFAMALIYRKLQSKMYADMEDEKSAEDFLTIKSEYDLSLKNMDMQNQRLWYLTLIISIVLVALLLGAVFYFRIREVRFKNEEKERENKMLEERVANFGYLRSMHKSTIVRLAKMDKRLQDLIDESKKDSGEVPNIYLEMQSLIQGLRRNSNFHYVRVSEDFIQKQPNGEQLSEALDRTNKLIFMLCSLRFNQTEIASMVDMSRKSVMMRRYDIRNTLVKLGMPEKKATAMIFFGQEDEHEKENEAEIQEEGDIQE